MVLNCLYGGRIAVILTLGLLLNGCSTGDDRVTSKVAHVLDTTHPMHKSMVFMGQNPKNARVSRRN